MTDRHEGQVLVQETLASRYERSVVAGCHLSLADAPGSIGGTDGGPSPYDLLLSALGACTSMTLRMYAEHKQLPLRRVSMRLRHFKIHAKDCAECETKTGKVDHIEREIEFESDLDEAKRLRLLEFANHCPVHRTLSSEVHIDSEPAE